MFWDNHKLKELCLLRRKVWINARNTKLSVFSNKCHNIPLRGNDSNLRVIKIDARSPPSHATLKPNKLNSQVSPWQVGGAKWPGGKERLVCYFVCFWLRLNLSRDTIHTIRYIRVLWPNTVNTGKISNIKELKNLTIFEK